MTEISRQFDWIIIDDQTAHLIVFLWIESQFHSNIHSFSFFILLFLEYLYNIFISLIQNHLKQIETSNLCKIRYRKSPNKSGKLSFSRDETSSRKISNKLRDEVGWKNTKSIRNNFFSHFTSRINIFPRFAKFIHCLLLPAIDINNQFWASEFRKQFAKLCFSWNHLNLTSSVVCPVTFCDLKSGKVAFQAELSSGNFCRNFLLTCTAKIFLENLVFWWRFWNPVLWIPVLCFSNVLEFKC